jgi:8-oxo-dGTP diphosphatase
MPPLTEVCGYPDHMERYSYEFPRPALTVDVVVVHGEAVSRRILLIRRGNEPFKGMWALPGGFVDEYERPESAALRELTEETGLSLSEPGALRIAGVYGGRGRDPRGWTVSVVFLAELGPHGQASAATGSDDADEARWWSLQDLPELAFDHAGIVEDALGLTHAV